MRVLTLLALLVVLGGMPRSVSAQASPVPSTARQLVVVTTPSWGATTGTLARFERTDARGTWRRVGDAVPVNVGRSGLGWGRGLHAAADARRDEPGKREGDGRAPAGAFRLTGAFGYADTVATGLPYHASRPSSVCVDDPASRFYNLVFDPEATGAEVDWDSRETMRRADHLYGLGVTVAHNGPTADASWAPDATGDAPQPGGGSCIFLHVERAPGVPTAGCTSMPEPALAEALAWLRADADPVLVQLPVAVHRRVRAAWRLPLGI